MSNADCSTTVVLHGARLLTLTSAAAERPRCGSDRADLGVVTDGWIAMAGNTIVATGAGHSWKSAVKGSAPVEVIDVDGRVVLPGFVDSHTHLCFSGRRWDEFDARRAGTGVLSSLSAGGGIHATVRATAAESDDDLLALMRQRLASWSAMGTTTIEAKNGYGTDPTDELRHLRLLNLLRQEVPIDVSATYLAAHALPPSYRDDRPRFVADVVAAIRQVASNGLAEAVDVIYEDGVFGLDDVRPILETARDLGLRITLHADLLSDMGGATLAAQLGARSADHLTHVSEEGIDALRTSGTIAAVLPASALFLGHQPLDARRLVDAGVPVALGTAHNPGASPIEGMPTAISLAVALCGLTPAEAIVAATVNAAHLLGRGSTAGVLAPGRRADVVVLETDDERELAYRLGCQLVRRVYANGRELRPRPAITP